MSGGLNPSRGSSLEGKDEEETMKKYKYVGKKTLSKMWRGEDEQEEDRGPVSGLPVLLLPETWFIRCLLGCFFHPGPGLQGIQKEHCFPPPSSFLL